MKFPFTEQAVKYADEYAKKAIPYTHLHDGFEDTKSSQQYNRWMTGGIAQNIVMEYCKINNIECIQDNTTHEQNDNFDLKIQGYLFDIKATNTNIQCQVNHTSIKKIINGRTNCFFFMRIDKNFKWYEPIGFCTAKYYNENQYWVDKGDKIPFTNFINKFGITHTMEESDIQYKGLESLGRIKHRKAV